MCKICEGIEDLVNENTFYISISEDSRGFWLSLDDRKYKRINFCPICGKKLTPFEVNE
jgi:hypothetical protein